jgi:hypothetical protein
MIDPLAVVIAYLKAQPTLADLCGERIAHQHRFGMDERPDTTIIGWPVPSTALTVALVSGEPQDDTTMRHRLELRCWAETPADAGALFAALNSCMPSHRVVVPLQDGTRALMYWLLLDDATVSDFDPDLHIPFIRVTARLSVASVAV